MLYTKGKVPNNYILILDQSIPVSYPNNLSIFQKIRFNTQKSCFPSHRVVCDC